MHDEVEITSSTRRIKNEVPVRKIYEYEENMKF